MKTDKIRLARRGDEAELMRLLRLMHAEENMAPMDEEKVLVLLDHMVGRRCGVVLVVRGARCLEAALGLIFGSWWFSSAVHLERLFDFVDPAHRRSTHAKDLLGVAKDYATGLGLPLIGTQVSNEQTEAKSRLMERQLGAPGGKLFVFRPAAA